MIPEELKQYIKFLHETEKLKTVLRHSWLSNGRRESVAEHSWRMALMAITMHSYLKKPVDLLRTIKMILVHDLGEIYATDFWAFNKQPANKSDLEKKGLKKVTKTLPKEIKAELLELWEEFEAAESREAKFAKFIDKHEVLLQHNEADVKFLNKKEIPLNLHHGKQWTTHDEILVEFRKIVDEETLGIYRKNKIDKKLYQDFI